MRKAIVEVRKQSPRGKWPKISPDIYVMIQVVPHGAIPLKRLDKKAACNRGILLLHIGEGYSQHRGKRSSLGKALEVAHKQAAMMNEVFEAEEVARILGDPKEAPEEIEV